MARPTRQLLSLILFVLYIVSIAKSFVPKNFIEASCGATRCPMVCVRSLSSNASVIQQSPYKLARSALTVSLAMIESTKKNMLKLTDLKGLKAMEYGALKECLDQIEDSMDQLSQSVREIEHLGNVQGEEFMWHKSNVQTWTSTALTEMGTCVEGFLSKTVDGKIKASVQGQVTNVEQLFSNALALVNNMQTNIK